MVQGIITLVREHCFHNPLRILSRTFIRKMGKAVLENWVFFVVNRYGIEFQRKLFFLGGKVRH